MTQAPPPPHEAVERLEADAQALLAIYPKGHSQRSLGEAILQLIAHLRQVEEREAGWRALADEMSDTIDLADRLIDEGHGCDTPKSWPKALQAVVKARSRTALTHSPETPETVK